MTRFPTMHTVLNILSTTAYWIVVCAVVALGFLVFVSKVPVAGNYQVKIVQSGSMEPSIKTGSIVVIKPEERYSVGDVVTFGEDTPSKTPTTHRIVAERLEEGTLVYTTKGDANEDEDLQTVALSRIIGRVLFSVPYVGFLLDFARTTLGFWVLIGLPAGFVIVDEGVTIYREVRMRKKPEEKGDARDPEESTQGITDSSS